MKTTFFSAIVIACALLLYVACENNPKHDPSISGGGLVSNTDCKFDKAVSTVSEKPDSISCVEYSFNSETGKLSLKHINAGFNCCPGELSCDVSLSGDTIIIAESEQAPMCNCNCLFDLDIVVNDVSAASYHVKFIEPYAGEQEKLEFSIDLSDETEGSFCVTRTQYPWGLGLF